MLRAIADVLIDLGLEIDPVAVLEACLVIVISASGSAIVDAASKADIPVVSSPEGDCTLSWCARDFVVVVIVFLDASKLGVEQFRRAISL